MSDTAANPKSTVYAQSVYNDSTNSYVHPDQISSHKQMYCSSRYTAKNIPSSTFSEADALVEFRIDPSAGNIDLMQLAWLQLGIRNNDAVNAADLLQSPFLLNRVEIYIAENLCETLYPSQLWAEQILLPTNEQWEAKASWMNYDAATGDATINNIPALSSAVSIIPLPLPQIAGKVPVSLVRQETQLRVYFNITPNVQTAIGTPSTALALESAYLYISGVKYHPAVKAVVSNALFGRSIACRFYRRNQTRNVVTLTAGAPFILPITEFNGFSPDVRYIVRDNIAPQNVSQGYKLLSRVTNYDENGNPLSLTAQDQGLIEWNMFRSYPNVARRMRFGANPKYIYSFAWADDVPGAVMDGLSSGDIRYKSNFSTEIVSATTGTYEILVHTYSKSVLTIENGACSFRIVTQGDDARGATQV